MKIFLALFALALAIVPLSAAAQDTRADEDEEEEFFDLPPGATWLEGPGMGKIGSMAEIQVPEDYVFTDGPGTRHMMELTENLVSDRQLGFIAPRDFSWFITFEYSDSGHVADDEKIDADRLMKDMKANNKRSNEERKRAGWADLNLVGWYKKPFYNTQTKNLEWAIELESEGHTSINHNVRFLGREGVMEVTNVADPEDFDNVVRLGQRILSTYRYLPGYTYGEYKKGDRLAEYGLAALIGGGAVAVAAKSGVFKYLWKIIVVVIAAVGGFFAKFFKGKKNKPEGPQ
jgi:uncharacterized membrane-anchored protein